MKNNQILLNLYFIVGLIYIAGDAINSLPLIYCTKPLLMALLGTYFWRQTHNARHQKMRILVAIGLLFAFVGDVLLMVARTQESFFVLGIAGFLVTQIAYTLAFARFKPSLSGLFAQNKLAAFPLLLYWVLMLVILVPVVPSALRVPIVAYSFFITLMALSALNLMTRIPPSVSYPLILGACLFLLSDSLIAINKFKMEIPMASLLIMSTYILAQWLIIRSSIDMSKR
jgi:uncharacterized membrane protein YhhN